MSRRTNTTQISPLPRRRGEALASAVTPRQLPSGVDKTLTKGLLLLEKLAEHEQSRGISELAHELALNKSNVHRLLQTLIRSGYVDREISTERYLLSPKLWRIARSGRPLDVLRRTVRPALRNLLTKTDESVVFVIIEGDELVLIDQVETQKPVRVYFSVGQSFQIDHVLAEGKGLTALQLVALAGRPQIEARLAIKNVQKQLHKGKSFGTQQLATIAAIRKQGFALSRGEWVSGVNAAAVPVSDPAGDIIGVLSCFGPADRVTDRALAKVQRLLRTTARELSQRLCE